MTALHFPFPNVSFEHFQGKVPSGKINGYIKETMPQRGSTDGDASMGAID
jgi:hypothetical protein